MNDGDFKALRPAYDEQVAYLRSELRRRFAGPDWDVFDSIGLSQRKLEDMMYRDVYLVRMDYCGARLESMITGQLLREHDPSFDPIKMLAKQMCAEMDQFQREQEAAQG
jgi:hypothetical protein